MTKNKERKEFFPEIGMPDAILICEIDNRIIRRSTDCN